MAKLIYSAITSLDGYVADEGGNFDWAVPDEEVHTFVKQCPPEARTAGRTPFWQRHGSPPLPHQDVRRRRLCPDIWDVASLLLSSSRLYRLECHHFSFCRSGQ